MKQKLTYKERYDIWFSNNYETGLEHNYDNIPDFDNTYYEPTPEYKTMQNKLDQYIHETIQEINTKGCIDQNPRPRYSDGEPAYSKFITHKLFTYDLSQGEYPITTLRTTPLRGCFSEMEWIYVKQTSDLSKADKSIYGWWKDFCLDGTTSIGQTYGYIVQKYDLMNKLLQGLEHNAFGRRHIVDMYQYTEQTQDPCALTPCCYSTTWNIREEEGVRYVDVLLNQRSKDMLVVAGINALQYTILIFMVCNHLTHKTGILYKPGKLSHMVANCHIYLRHVEQAQEMLHRESLGQPDMFLTCEPKNFYEHTFEDFGFMLPDGIKPLQKKLEIAV